MSRNKGFWMLWWKTCANQSWHQIFLKFFIQGVGKSSTSDWDLQTLVSHFLRCWIVAKSHTVSSLVFHIWGLPSWMLLLDQLWVNCLTFFQLQSLFWVYLLKLGWAYLCSGMQKGIVHFYRFASDTDIRIQTLTWNKHDLKTRSI